MIAMPGQVWVRKGKQYSTYVQCENQNETKITRMWADAQRDGRPAEYQWRPPFNAAKFGWCPLLDAVQ